VPNGTLAIGDFFSHLDKTYRNIVCSAIIEQLKIVPVRLPAYPVLYMILDAYEA
jgi:hypothetical protein